MSSALFGELHATMAHSTIVALSSLHNDGLAAPWRAHSTMVSDDLTSLHDGERALARHVLLPVLVEEFHQGVLVEAVVLVHQGPELGRVLVAWRGEGVRGVGGGGVQGRVAGSGRRKCGRFPSRMVGRHRCEGWRRVGAVREESGDGRLAQLAAAR